MGRENKTIIEKKKEIPVILKYANGCDLVWISGPGLLGVGLCWTATRDTPHLLHSAQKKHTKEGRRGGEVKESKKMKPNHGPRVMRKVGSEKNGDKKRRNVISNYTQTTVKSLPVIFFPQS